MSDEITVGNIVFGNASSGARRMSMADVAAQPVEVDRIAYTGHSPDQLLAVLTTLEADLEKARSQRDTAIRAAASNAADLAASREREAALAVALKNAEETITAAMASASVMNLSAAASRLSAYILCGKDYAVTLAAHDAAIERKAKVEALEKLHARLVEQHYFVLGAEVSCEIREVIAALKAEGGRG